MHDFDDAALVFSRSLAELRTAFNRLESLRYQANSDVHPDTLSKLFMHSSNAVGELDILSIVLAPYANRARQEEEF